RARARDRSCDPARQLARDLGFDFGSDLVADLGSGLGLDPARCPARGLVPDFGRRARAASRRSSMDCARRSRNSRDGGGGRRRSRPRPPPAPPQAAKAPSAWGAAPLVLAPNNARDGVGFGASAGAPTCVTPGLDPGVHLLGKNFFRSGWIAGSSPAMTIRYFAAGIFSTTT